jgi:hypothetical protein
VTIHGRQVQQHREPRRKLHEGSYGRTLEPEDKVAFPVSRHCPVVRFRRTFADVKPFVKR